MVFKRRLRIFSNLSLKSRYLLFYCAGLLTLYLICLRTLENVPDVRTSIMIQNFNRIINNNLAIRNTIQVPNMTENRQEMLDKINDSFCLVGQQEVKSKLVNAMGGFTCSLAAATDERECKMAERRSVYFFANSNVMDRLRDPYNYFDKIANVAYKPLTNAESKTPLAYSILCHGNIGLLEAQLASIFRPQNAYCIYVDAKAPMDYKRAVLALAGVYKEHFPKTLIIVANPTRRIYWSDVSILEAGLDCLEQLLTQGKEWKFFLNTVGTALPGRPIQDITELISHLSGDVIASVPMTEQITKYTQFKQRLPRKAETINFDKFETDKFMYHDDLLPYRTTIPKERPPRGIVPYYNMTESVISRSTAEFVLTNPLAKEFREWLQDIKAPEEFFYATLARVDRKSVADGDKRVYMDPDIDTTQGLCPRYSNWNGSICHGQMKRWICNFAMGDLPTALSTKCIWMNKFDLNFDPRPVACMHEYLTQ